MRKASSASEVRFGNDRRRRARALVGDAPSRFGLRRSENSPPHFFPSGRLFGSTRFAEVLIAEEEGTAAGFALFFHNYSTFLAQPGIYLEDLFVRPEFRGRGYGKALLARLAQIARERHCGRVEWAVLDWNEPSIAFYKSIGAQVMDEWHTFRLTGEAMEKLAGR